MAASSSSSFVPPGPAAPEVAPLPMTVPAVNTIQSVRSPIWSVPTVSEGHLSVGARVTITDSLAPLGVQVQQAQDVPFFTSPVTMGTRRVVVKQIAKQPTQTTSPVQTVSLAQQLASQLTPQQAQNLLLRSLAASQTQQPAPAATTGFPVAMTQGRRVIRKPIMPKQQQPGMGRGQAVGSGAGLQPGMGRGQVVVSGAGLQRPIAPGNAAVGATLMAGAAGMLQSLSAAPQRIMAPVAVPPASTASVPPTLAPSLSREPQLPPPPVSDPKGAGSTQPGITTSKPRKPCNCKNSQCLKLYCDCFANGEFCREGCHCQNCKNNMEHAEDRARAVKTCLDRNPHAFKPKVGQKRAGDERRHIKGCNCKRSGCLKNYCECYEAKISCSNLCRCIGCKNLADKPENKSLMQLADAADIRTQQQKAATSHFLEQLDLSASKPQPITHDGRRLPFSFITKEVAKATCLCLLEEASHAAMNGQGQADVERVVLEEFGRCMSQIINSAQTANETGLGRPMVVR